MNEGKQDASIKMPISTENFTLWNNQFYFGFLRQVCTADELCLPTSLVPWLLNDFGIFDNYLFESIKAITNADGFFEPSSNYDNLQISNLVNGNTFSVRLQTWPANEEKSAWEKNRYTLPRTFRKLSKNRAIAISDQYQGSNIEAFSLVLLEWNNAQSTTPAKRVEFYKSGQIAKTIAYDKNEKLTITQRYLSPSHTSTPQELYPVHEGKYVITDDGNVYETSSQLQKVAILEAPIEDVVEYGDYTIVLSAGRILLYNEKWHLQGEFSPAVPPQGLGIVDSSITFFSMLTENSLFTENHDVNDFFKKQHVCLISEEKLLAFQPKDSFQLDGNTFAVSSSDGCVLKKVDNRWIAWMGMQKNPAQVFYFLEKGLIFTVDKKSTFTSLKILLREENLITKFAMDYIEGFKQGEYIELHMHNPAYTERFLHKVILNSDGRILEEQDYFAPYKEEKIN